MAPFEEKKCANCGRLYSSQNDFYSNTKRWRICTRKNLWFNCACGSTLMIPEGKFPWYSPTKNLSSQAASVFNTLTAFGTLPHLSASIMEIQQMMTNDATEVSELAKRIKLEPFIATNIMSLANTMKSNRDPHDKVKIDRIEHAITFMGRKCASDVIMSLALKSFTIHCKEFKSDRFWRESFLIGHIAESLCIRLKLKFSRDEIFLAGSLCNLGKIVLALYLPSTIDRIDQKIRSPKTLSTWRAAEREIGAPDHCILGEIGSAIWGLPSYVSDACIGHHISLTTAAERDTSPLTTIELIALANQISHWILLQPERIEQNSLRYLSKLANLSKEDIELIAFELRKSLVIQQAA